MRIQCKRVWKSLLASWTGHQKAPGKPGCVWGMSLVCREIGQRHNLIARCKKAFASTAVAAVLTAGLWAGFGAPAVSGGETRTISLYQVHTKESLKVTYMKDGKYIPSAIKKINYILRDWRRNEVITIDPKTIKELAKLGLGVAMAAAWTPRPDSHCQANHGTPSVHCRAVDTSTSCASRPRTRHASAMSSEIHRSRKTFTESDPGALLPRSAVRLVRITEGVRPDRAPGRSVPGAASSRSSTSLS